MDLTDSKSKVLKAVDSPLRLFALVAILINASMFGIAGTMDEGMDRTIVIVGAILLLLIILTVVAFNFNPKPSMLEKISEGKFKIYDGNHELGNLWEGFVKVYKSFNDPWRMEYDTPSQFLDIHKKRYSSKNCGEFQFIFFLNNGVEAFDRFIKFQSMVHLNLSSDDIYSNNFKSILSERMKKKLPETLKFITVFINKTETPTRTFFLGFKEPEKPETVLKRISLLYINIANEDLGHKMILQSSDKDFWNDLDKKWEASRNESERIQGSMIFERYLEMVKTDNKVKI